MAAWTDRFANIFLTGFMCAGKSTVGREVASVTGTTFVDLDERVEKAMGMTIANAINERGEAWFRATEARTFRDVASSRGQVVSLGGGTLLDPENMKLAEERGVMVWLRVSEKTAFSRAGNGATRPLLRPGLLAEREATYARAMFAVETDGRTVDEVANAVIRELAGAR